MLQFRDTPTHLLKINYALDGIKPRAYVDGQLDALSRANDAVTCTIVGDLTRAEMEDIASEVFKALSWQKQPYQLG